MCLFCLPIGRHLLFKLGFCHFSMHLVSLLGLNKSLSLLNSFPFGICFLDTSDSSEFLFLFCPIWSLMAKLFERESNRVGLLAMGL